MPRKLTNRTSTALGVLLTVFVCSVSDMAGAAERTRSQPTGRTSSGHPTAFTPGLLVRTLRRIGLSEQQRRVVFAALRDDTRGKEITPLAEAHVLLRNVGRKHPEATKILMELMSRPWGVEPLRRVLEGSVTPAQLEQYAADGASLGRIARHINASNGSAKNQKAKGVSARLLDALGPGNMVVLRNGEWVPDHLVAATCTALLVVSRENADAGRQALMLARDPRHGIADSGVVDLLAEQGLLEVDSGDPHIHPAVGTVLRSCAVTDGGEMGLVIPASKPR